MSLNILNVLLQIIQQGDLLQDPHLSVLKKFQMVVWLVRVIFISYSLCISADSYKIASKGLSSISVYI